MSDMFWARYMISKYVTTTGHAAIASIKPSNSQTWRRMIGVRDFMVLHMQTLVRDGSLSFWFDNWLGTGPLAEGKQGTPSSSLVIKNLIAGAEWKLDRVDEALTEEDRRKILNFRIHHSTDWDQYVWTATPDGKFKIQMALERLRKSTNPLISRKLIWNRRIPLKLSIFMWCLLNHLLPFPDML